MSKAAYTLPVFQVIGGNVAANKNERGDLYIRNVVMTQLEALAFAKWIVETFGETETK